VAQAARQCLAVLLLVLGVYGWTAEVLAHTALLSSDPADGAVLAKAPAFVLLRFDEEVGLIQLRLVGPGGIEVLPLEPPQVISTMLRVRYATDLPPGVYLLSYRVASADSHPVAGTVVFTFGQPSGPERAAMPNPVPLATSHEILPSLAARWLYYVAVAAAAGGALFRSLVAETPGQLRSLLFAIALCGIGLAALQVGLRGTLLAALPLGALLETATWHLGAGTTLAFSLLFAVAGLLGCAISMLGTKWAWRALGGVAALLVLVSFPLTGHAAVAVQRWLIAPTLAVHAAVAMFWFGALWPLYAVLRQKPARAAAVIKRFSRLAVPAVLLLVAGGGVLAAIQLARPAAPLDTWYGLLVSAKLLLFMGLLGLATWNRQRLTPALAANVPDAAWRLQRTVKIEGILAAVVLAVTAALTLTMPRTSVGDHEAVNSVHGSHRTHTAPVAEGMAVLTQAQDITALIAVSPARAGLNSVRVVFNRVKGDPPALKEVWLELSEPGAGVLPARRPLVRDARNGWTYEGPELAILGRWTVRVEALLTDFDQMSFDAVVDIQ
jgi:copper transport protein